MITRLYFCEESHAHVRLHLVGAFGDGVIFTICDREIVRSSGYPGLLHTAPPHGAIPCAECVGTLGAIQKALAGDQLADGDDQVVEVDRLPPPR